MESKIKQSQIAPSKKNNKKKKEERGVNTLSKVEEGDNEPDRAQKARKKIKE